MMKRKQSGFTLIEIAIVLVIIGLLLGGVLKGQELINSAKVKNLATDFKNVPVFIYGYQDKFKALPGDDINAVSHVAATGVGNGNGIINGNWNSTNTADETQLFWQDVRLAGLAPGPTTGTDLLPTNSAGGVIGITNGATYANGGNNPVTGLKGTFIICSSSILGKFVKQLDTTLDDGSTNTGSMMAIPNTARPTTAEAAPVATDSIDDATPYTVCMGV